MHYDSNFENIVENLHFNTPKFASRKQVKTHVTFIAHSLPSFFSNLALSTEIMRHKL